MFFSTTVYIRRQEARCVPHTNGAAEKLAAFLIQQQALLPHLRRKLVSIGAGGSMPDQASTQDWICQHISQGPSAVASYTQSRTSTAAAG